MGACRHAVTVLIVLLWAIGGIPTSSGGSRGDHTGDDGHGRVLVARRPEAAMVSSSTDAGDDDAHPMPLVNAAPAVERPTPTIDPPRARLVASASVDRTGSPRGPPALG